MARHISAGNAPDGGTKRRGGLASFLRERRWVKCWIFSDQYALCLTMEQRSSLRRASVALLDASGGETGQRSWRGIALGGQCLVPSPERVSVRGRNSALTFQREGSTRRVFGCAEGFREDQALLFDLRLTGGQEADIPAFFPEQARRCSRRRFTGCLRAEGRAEMVGEEYLFAPAHSFALLEEGVDDLRGCPSMESAAAGWIEGTAAALLLDGTTQENVLMMAGRTWKLGPLSWNNPGPVSPGSAARSAEKNAASDLLWQFIGPDGRGALTFNPLAEQSGTPRGIFLRKESEIQIFGHFSGQLRLENGRTVTFRRLSGAVQRRHPGGE